jgi:3-methylcrotonyl-CoA carboxylase beta subunit
VDFREPDDPACIKRLRSLVDKLGPAPAPAFDRKKSEAPAYPEDTIYGVFSSAPGKQYDMHEIIARIVDGSHFDEYRAEYGRRCFAGMPASAAGRWESWRIKRNK